MADTLEQLAQRIGMPVGEVSSIRDGIVAMMVQVKPSLAQKTLELDTTFQDLGIDSMTVISIVFEVEEFFRIDIVGRHLDAVRTLGETVTVVAQLVAEKHGARVDA
ncbi:acyl carrier protein [Burkholderia alba]|uniref:acyl carrier protein n=1 Tax=Burkholderia alba TaxID=2683677 RepID=UPI002B05901A|nr:acyl carrier protein [Burkholderia alba]